jgi:hypothetical protein
MFFFLQAFFTLMILAVALLVARRSHTDPTDFALLFVAIMLASPNTASYTFILSLLPVSLLMEQATRLQKAFLAVAYVAVSLPGNPQWNIFFPKLWMLLALLLFAGSRCADLLRKKELTLVLALATVSSVLVAYRRELQYEREPGRRWERIDVRPGAIYSSSPATLSSGILYESIGKGRYVLRLTNAAGDREFAFDGEAFHPHAVSPAGSVQFELVAHGASKHMLLDVRSGNVTPITAEATETRDSNPISPDGQWRAITAFKNGSQEISVQELYTRRRWQIAGGECNSNSPVWSLDSKSLIFASDCDRGIGLPALYQARLEHLDDR